MTVDPAGAVPANVTNAVSTMSPLDGVRTHSDPATGSLWVALEVPEPSGAAPPQAATKTAINAIATTRTRFIGRFPPRTIAEVPVEPRSIYEEIAAWL